MLSQRALGSSSSAAGYYANDNYYSVDEQTEHSEWGGEAARELGLEGPVEGTAFEKILAGDLPNGEQVGRKGEGHRAGIDLTFSAPKSVSLLALVGGDKRIIAAHKDAVRTTMTWVEKNFAQGQIVRSGETTTMRTGKLAYALFEHDTSRKLDPQLHIHAVVANVTRRPDGQWRVLHNDAIMKNNTVIGSIYHAELRSQLEKLGYATDLTGKHGTFEVRGISRDAVELFSQRRAEILAIAERLGKSSPAALGAIAERSRGGKTSPEPDNVRAAWKALAADHGHDFGKVIEASHQSKAEPGLMQRVRETGQVLIDKVGAMFAPRPDPLIGGTDAIKRSPALAAVYAVAAGVRHLSERDAVFTRVQLIKNALDFGQKGVTVAGVEARMATLTNDGVLNAENDDPAAKMTTRDMRTLEGAIIGMARAGQGAAMPIVPARSAAERVQDAALLTGHRLNAGQEASATAIISRPDRVLLIQGIAGAGKTSMLAAAAKVLSEEGRPVLGLAFQNKMVDDLKGSARIDAMTVHRFVMQHQGLLDGNHGALARDALPDLRGGVLLLDEASMISNRQMFDVMQIAQRLEVAKLVLVGDAKQIAAIEAGRPFGLMQEAGVPTAIMDENLRQRDPDLHAAVAFAADGDPRAALHKLGDRVIETDDPVRDAAARWLSLDYETRAETKLATSGRAARAGLIEAVREGLVKEGTLGDTELRLPILENLNLTREQMRHLPNYREGLILEVHKDHPKQGLSRGQYRIAGVDPERNNVAVARFGGGGYQRFDPASLHPAGKGLALSDRSEIGIRVGDTLAWTANDQKRELLNASEAVVTGLDGQSVNLKTASGDSVSLRPDDPMRQRLTHAIALNANMAQGISPDRVIETMDSRERHLSNEALFYMLSSRPRDDLILYVDNIEKLADRLENTPGINSAAADVPAKHWTDDVITHDPVTGEIMSKLDASPNESMDIDPYKLLGVEPPLPPPPIDKFAFDRPSGREAPTPELDYDMGM
jgi:conjugative relaxase-like TrwC/TraI family protein